MNIAIVEDKIEDRLHLQALIEQYCAGKAISAQITCFSSGDSLMEQFQPGMFQCIFLDIYMDGTDGMDTARQIYRMDPDCRLIFSTVSLTHAVTSYEVHAAWYLTKPISTARLADAMDTVCADLQRDNRHILLHVRGTLCQVRFSEIYYIDCMNRQARLHLQDRTLPVDEAVSHLTQTLSSDPRFLVCNRNTVVNMDHIQQVSDGDFRLKNGHFVPLRQRGRAALKKEFLTWSLRELR